MLREGSAEDLFKKVPHLSVEIPTEKELGYWLARFVLEVRRTDKKKYPADSLWNMCCGLQRYLRQFRCSLFLLFLFFLHENFVDFYHCLDSMMKEVSKEGMSMEISVD